MFTSAHLYSRICRKGQSYGVGSSYHVVLVWIMGLCGWSALHILVPHNHLGSVSKLSN